MKSYVYLDNASATELAKPVFSAMKPFLTSKQGNPSSLHKKGLEAKLAINEARSEVARILECSPKEVIFTSGGTESINLAIFGVARQYTIETKKVGHIITSKIEHEAVLESVKALSEEGWKIDYLPVDTNAVVQLDKLNGLIRKDTVLISVMYANNETGTIQPIADLGKMVTGINRKRFAKKLPPIAFHTDACQAGGVLDLNVQKLKVDLLTLNGSKLSGPKGSGILFKRSSVKIRPIIFGGGQESSLRSGTENTPAIIGFAVGLKLAQQKRKAVVKKILQQQSWFEQSVKKNLKSVTINGPKNHSFKSQDSNFGLQKLPSTTNLSIKGVEGEALMYYLDAAGFGVATGSACTTGSTDASHVLLAMGIKPKVAKSTIRISLGYNITKQELSKFITVLSKTVDVLKNTSQEL